MSKYYLITIAVACMYIAWKIAKKNCLLLFFRRQAARLEAKMAFQDIALADGKRRYTTLQKLKAKQFHGTDASKTKTSRLTRVEKARMEALESFKGATLDTLPVRNTR